MTSHVVIEDESIWLKANDTLIPGSPRDALEAIKNGSISTRTFRVIGLASPRILVFLDVDGTPKYRVEAVSGLETFSLGQTPPRHPDYVVHENVIIPLRSGEFEPLFESIVALPELGIELTPERLASALLKLATKHHVAIAFSDDFQELLDDSPVREVDSPVSALWPYQRIGFSWMYRLWDYGLGGILGDEMGVGKTLQLLALVCAVSNSASSQPALVVVPGNLLLKWCTDFVTFAPSFANHVHVHRGSDRPRNSEFLATQKIILTTYSMLVQDERLFSEIDFSIVCCDEAHELKDGRTLRSKAVSNLNSKAKFLATGTPIQNRLMDYWSLIDIIEPGLLGERNDFEGRCADTPSEAALLMRQTTHRILRRTQEQVELEIPEGTEFMVPLVLDEDLYDAYLEISHTADAESNSPGGGGFGSVKRQFCAHPASLITSLDADAGAKAEYLTDELSKIIEWGEKAVVFVADFNRPRDLYKELITSRFPNLWVATIDGRVLSQEERFAILRSFSSQNGSAVLLVNPTVGGQGLDMVAANHVFHMNPAWNPSKTDQATFRVHRPGQQKETWSHHVYYVGTIEDAINDLVQAKRELTDAALEVAEKDSLENKASIMKMFGIEKGEHNE